MGQNVNNLMDLEWVHKSSLYYFHNFSINLKPNQNKKITKKFKESKQPISCIAQVRLILKEHKIQEKKNS